MDSIEERVARGVEWLDAIQPEWRDRVNPDFLEMSLGTSCVLGQLFADRVSYQHPTGYWYALVVLMGNDPYTTRERGFAALHCDWSPRAFEQQREEYRALNEEWKRQLV